MNKEIFVEQQEKGWRVSWVSKPASDGHFKTISFEHCDTFEQASRFVEGELLA